MKVEKILVPVDFSDTAASGIERALTALAPGGKLTLVNVIDMVLANQIATITGTPESSIADGLKLKAVEQLADLCTSLGDRAKGIEIEQLVVTGLPFREINKAAEEREVDLLIMTKFGTHGRVEKALFGTTAEKVLRWATVPTLILP